MATRLSTALDDFPLNVISWDRCPGSILLPFGDQPYSGLDLDAICNAIRQQFQTLGVDVAVMWANERYGVKVSWGLIGAAPGEGVPISPEVARVLSYIRLQNEENAKSEVGTTGQEIDPEGVNHPSHYNQHPSGVECVDIAQHYNFNVGNAIKYLWRAGLKTTEGPAREAEVKDIKKAVWYLNQELKRLSLD